jgi:hypothetical protein
MCAPGDEGFANTLGFTASDRLAFGQHPNQQ